MPTWSVTPSRMKWAAISSPIRSSAGGREIVDRLHMIVDEVIHGRGVNDALALGEGHTVIQLGDDARGMIDGCVEGFDRQSQAVLARHLVRADFENGYVGHIGPVFADQAVQVGQGAGQIEGAAFIGRLAHVPPGKDGIGHDPVLEPRLHIGDGALEEDMDHPEIRQLGPAHLEGGGDGVERGGRRRGVRSDVHGDRVSRGEFPGDDVRDVTQLDDGGLMRHGWTPLLAWMIHE